MPESTWYQDLWKAIAANPLAAAGVIVVASFVAARLADWLLTRVVKVATRRTRTELDDELLERLHGPVVKTFVLFGLATAATYLDLTEQVEQVTHRILVTIVILVWVAAGLHIANILLRGASARPDRFQMVEPRTFPLFDNLAKLLIVAAAAYLAIVTWQVDATGWLASAGIVGLAIGFAAQDTLANLFAGVFIIADAPYQVGDMIVLDSGDRGRVIHIGLRSTRVLTRDDIEVTIPNSVMGAARITNESRGPSPKRRLRIAVGVAYGSDVDEVRRILLEVAEADGDVCADPEPRVRFRAFGESSLDFELLCWVDDPELRGRVVDSVNTAVYKRFAAEGVTIPFPQRDLHIVSTVAPSGGATPQ